MALKQLVNFSGGIASRKLRARADTTVYSTVVEQLDNFLVTKYGSAMRTPGTRYVSQVKDSDNEVRLIPFIFSTGDSYLLEFGNQYIRFFTPDGSVVEASKTITGITQANPGVVTSASHGYSNGDYVDISGVTGMTEVNGKRYIVANQATNTFELTDEDGNNVDTSGFTAYSSGGIAEKVYEISSPFVTADLDDLKFTQQGDIMYIASGSKEIKKLSRFGATNWTIAGITYDTVVYPPFNGINTTTTTITPSATTGSGITLTASASLFNSNHVGSYWKLDHSGTIGYVKITAYSSATSVTADVIVTLGGTTATDDWYEGSWSDDQGYPVDVKFFRNRLYYIGSTKRPLTIWSSVIEEYENLNTDSDGDGDIAETDSFSFTLSSVQNDKALWAYPALVLTIGTAAGPFTLDVTSALEVDQARQQNENGASSVTPVRVGNNIYYVERSGERMGEYKISTDLLDVYETTDITYLSDEILDSGVKEMALQRYPESIIWCVLNNGEIASLTRGVDQNIKGWAKQIPSGTDAEFENIAVIPNGSEDQVWTVCKRTINEITRRYVEYFETHDFGDDKEDAFFVQSGLTYDGSAVGTFTNLDHLEGETVSILADGAVYPDQVVTDGSVTLPNSQTASVAQIGLSYDSILKTMDIEMASELGTAQTRVKFISKLFIRLIDSLGMKAGSEDVQDIVLFRDGDDLMDSAPPLFSGDKEIPFPSGHSRNKFVIIKQEQPLPLHVLGIYIKMKVSP